MSKSQKWLLVGMGVVAGVTLLLSGVLIGTSGVLGRTAPQPTLERRNVMPPTWTPVLQTSTNIHDSQSKKLFIEQLNDVLASVNQNQEDLYSFIELANDHPDMIQEEGWKLGFDEVLIDWKKDIETIRSLKPFAEYEEAHSYILRACDNWEAAIEWAEKYADGSEYYQVYIQDELEKSLLWILSASRAIPDLSDIPD